MSSLWFAPAVWGTLVSTALLIGMVMTLAAYGRHPVVRCSPRPFGALLTLCAAAAYLGEFGLWPWHANWGNDAVHVALTLLNTVFFFGGGVVVGGDVLPDQDGIAIREGCLTHRTAKLFGVDLTKRSLCSISWTMVLVMLFVPVLTAVAALFFTIIGIGQFLLTGDNPVAMATFLLRQPKELTAPFKMCFIGKTMIPRSPLLWAAVGTAAWLLTTLRGAIPWHVVGDVALIATLFLAFAFGILMLSFYLSDKHHKMMKRDPWDNVSYEIPADFGTDPLGYVTILGKAWKQQICPTVTLRTTEEIEKEIEAEANQSHEMIQL